MLISHKGHTDTIQVYSVTVMTHVKALQAGHSSQGTSEPITPAIEKKNVSNPYTCIRILLNTYEHITVHSYAKLTRSRRGWDSQYHLCTNESHCSEYNAE